MLSTYTRVLSRLKVRKSLEQYSAASLKRSLMKTSLYWTLLALPLAAALSSTARAEQYLVSGYFSNSVTRWNANGTAAGNLSGATLNGPQAVRLGPDGKLYVADENNHRILRYNATTGTYLDTFVTAGNGGLSGPTAMTWNANGELLVASFNGDNVLRYSATGAFLGSMFAPGTGGLNGPDVGMTVGPDGLLYVPSFWNGRVLRYNATTGAFVDTFVLGGGLQTPRQMLWRGNDLFVSDDFGSKVNRYSASTGAFLGTFVTAGSGGLNGASGMAWDGNGNLLVTSLGTNSVLRYSGASGAYLDTFLSGGSFNGPTWIMAVPEPGTMTAVATGLALAVASRRRRKG